ncbi:hypothetical protein [Streptomyces sp. NPDC048392]
MDRAGLRLRLLGAHRVVRHPEAKLCGERRPGRGEERDPAL